jgi:hypothetical protein
MKRGPGPNALVAHAREAADAMADAMIIAAMPASRANRAGKCLSGAVCVLFTIEQGTQRSPVFACVLITQPTL